MNKNELHPIEIAIVAALVVAEAVAVVVVAVVALALTVAARRTRTPNLVPPAKAPDLAPGIARIQNAPSGSGHSHPHVHPLAVLAEQLEALPATTLRTMAGTRSKRLRKRELVAVIACC